VKRTSIAQNRGINQKMSRKKKTDLEKIREQLDREILWLISATVYRLVQKANVSEDNPLEKKLSIYILEYLKVLCLITNLFKSNFLLNVNADVPSFVTELAKKAVEGMDVEELVSEVKEMLEKGISKRKTMRKPPGEPEYISFMTDDKWKRF
jgi:hypothetical protein